MIVYGISGLGADKRVFEYLDLECEFVPVQWLVPNEKESLKDYSKRLANSINQKESFGLLGVSFGGMVAVEISKILNPKITILVSSAETKFDLRKIYRLVGQLNIISRIPTFLFDPPRKLAHFLFGTQQIELLNAILDDTNLDFAKWAIVQLSTWSNEEKIDNCIKISGGSDKLIPAIKDDKTILIDRGEHFMVVDQAGKISEIINQKLKKID